MAFKPWKVFSWAGSEIGEFVTSESGLIKAVFGGGALGGLPLAQIGLIYPTETGDLVESFGELAGKVGEAGLSSLRFGEELWNRIPDELLAPVFPMGGLAMFTPARASGGVLLAGPGGVMAGLSLFNKAGEYLEQGVVELADWLGAFDTRTLTDNEWSFAEDVFGDSLPPRHTIRLTNIGFGNGRPFVFPLFRNGYMINYGSEYHSTTDFSVHDPAVFAHELTHVWQSKQRPLKVTIYAEAAKDRQYSFPYGRQWRHYGLEQQGEIVEQWVEQGRSKSSPMYRYIRTNLRTSNNTANSHQFFNMSSAVGIRELFNACNGYANTIGRGAVLPNLHHIEAASEPGVGRANATYGTIQFHPGSTVWMDLPGSVVGARGSRDSPKGIRERFTSTHDWAVGNGFVGGFPNLHHRRRGRDLVCGTFLLDAATAEFRDLDKSALPAVRSSRDSSRGIVERFNAVHDYAVSEGFVGGFPTLHETGAGLIGVVLVRAGAASWADVSFEDLVSAAGW